MATTGPPVPVTARPIIAAGFDLPPGTATSPKERRRRRRDDHPHDEAAWRLRHLKRSILKDVSPIVVPDGDEALRRRSLFGRAMGSAASMATHFFTDFPFSGEVNLLTTGALGTWRVFSTTTLPRGVAYLALSAPGAGRRLDDARRDERGGPVVLDCGRGVRVQSARPA